MSQKLNPINLRLKKRLNWKFLMAVQNIKDYTNLYQNTDETLTLMNFILLKLGFYSNEKNLTKNSKKLNISSKILEDTQILKEMIKTNKSEKFNLKTEVSSRKLNLQEKKRQLVRLNINSAAINSNFSDLDNLKNNLNVKLDEKKSVIIWPNLITEYVKDQLNKPKKQKNKLFNTSLQLGLLKYLITLLTTEFITWSELHQKYKRTRVTIKNVTGLKIQLNGKWKKTKAGRKQTLNFSFGQTRKISVDNLIVFESTKFKTKYAACGLKIWIAFKNSNSPFLA